MKPDATTPVRRRKLATAETVSAPSAELVSLAAQVMQANTEMNATKKAYETKRAELLRDMKNAGFRNFNATAVVNGKTVSFEATISTPVGTAIDVAKLRTLVTDDVFMAIVGASKGAVETGAGAAVATQCSVSVTGSENVAVKPLKA